MLPFYCVDFRQLQFIHMDGEKTENLMNDIKSTSLGPLVLSIPAFVAATTLDVCLADFVLNIVNGGLESPLLMHIEGWIMANSWFVMSQVKALGLEMKLKMLALTKSIWIQH